jgi:hypothetical protein
VNTMTLSLDQYGRLFKQQIEDVKLTLGRDPPADVRSILYSRLVNCSIDIMIDRGSFSIEQSVLTDCTIRVLKTMRDDNAFMRSHYYNCIFKGTYWGVDFGKLQQRHVDHYNEDHPEGPLKTLDDFGDLRGCDFTQSKLQWCRFQDVDVTTCKFAPWPQLVILNPLQRKEQLTRGPWPGKLQKFFDMMAGANPRYAGGSWTAKALMATDVAKDYGVTEAELRECLERIGDVLM